MTRPSRYLISASGVRWNPWVELDEAIDYCRQAVNLDPSSAGAHADLGHTLMSKGRLDESLLHFQRACRLDPSNARTRSNLGTVLMRLSRTEEAIGEFRLAIRNKPDLAAVQLNLGLGLAALDRTGEAIEHYRRELSLQPGLFVAQWKCSEALLVADRTQEARDAARNAVDLTAPDHPFHESAVRHLDVCERRLGLERRLAAVLNGEDRPRDIAEHLAFADLCRIRRQYSDACACTRQPSAAPRGWSTTWRRPTVIRRRARRPLRARGTLNRDIPRDQRERARWRRQSLAWLQSDRDARFARASAGGFPGRVALGKSLLQWERDDQLTGLREWQALAILPADERREWLALWESVAALLAGTPIGAIEQARSYASRKAWAMAAESYARFLEMAPTDDGETWFEYAAAQLLAGDLLGYRRACAHMLDRCRVSPQMRPYHAARACTLAPGESDLAARATSLATKELRDSDAAFWSLTEQAALAHRAGRSIEAVPLLERSIEANENPGAAVLNWFWLALAHRDLYHADQAQLWMSKAKHWLDEQGDAMPPDAERLALHRHNWLEAHALRKEAEGRPAAPERK